MQSGARPSLSFTPKFLTLWREGELRRSGRTDAVAGLTIAIVALPLAMARQEHSNRTRVVPTFRGGPGTAAYR